MLETKMYLEFIEKTLKEEGIKVADAANKIALEKKEISTEQYSQAARLIVKAYLAN